MRLSPYTGYLASESSGLNDALSNINVPLFSSLWVDCRWRETGFNSNITLLDAAPLSSVDTLLLVFSIAGNILLGRNHVGIRIFKSVWTKIVQISRNC